MLSVYKQTSEFSIEFLKNLKIKIESLDKCHHTKIFEILSKNNLPYSENRNGIFINMNLLNDKVINDILEYIQYVNKQEQNLKDIENIKMDFKKDFF